MAQMTAAQLLAWWDATMSGLMTRHPRLSWLFSLVKGIGDAEIPNIIGMLPSLPNPKALFDWVMTKLEAAFPTYAGLLAIVQAIVDSYLQPAGALPTLPKP